MGKTPEPKKGYKMPKGYLRGKARRRGAPIIHEEAKEKLNLTLTPTAINKLSQAAFKAGVSRSELVERWVRENL
ncbi:hypothetical protein G7B40_040945 [Aetokthonos hydrillicola Thurmond2011]|jgi:type II secretory pathway predicted ATPase ExeA|uniref:Ribbon-helix-helix protein CopG domain-containing protein n=1 Tax=Aetokthonos hydrillicola Thurmond2011 TaxID=2712845 RepID=A0AAP5MDP5_9CYAN|nr:hypothetical protein [Aetokthonos hydrillicola]MBO3463398.1 hypothetical protein [Aetokthonos hydrillicola CCALA 1050]MBW4590857.1 hypothetical protein [Aetokthonos hydrillicola CCALA 1050]MDR9900857.1 hypothetical protein [Aetokthonos hydrillicola Thurmond2011]